MDPSSRATFKPTATWAWGIGNVIETGPRFEPGIPRVGASFEWFAFWGLVWFGLGIWFAFGGFALHVGDLVWFGDLVGWLGWCFFLFGWLVWFRWLVVGCSFARFLSVVLFVCLVSFWFVLFLCFFVFVCLVGMLCLFL